MALFPTNSAQVQTFATALYGVAVGTTTMAQVTADIQAAGGLNNALNAYYTASFGTATTASVAATIVANVGLGTDANAIAFVTAQLNAAAPAARGAAVIAMLDNFLNITTGTYAAAAAAFNTTVANAVSYTGSNNTTVGTIPAVVTTFTLSTGVDNYVGAAGNNVFNAVGNSTTGAAFSALDSITGGSGTNTLNWSYTGAAITAVPAGSLVAGVQNVNVSSDSAITLDTTKNFIGLINLSSTTGAAAQSITSAATTNIATTSSSGDVTIVGGLNATVTTSAGAVTVGGVVGSTASPAGVINVTDSAAADKAINVDGGSNVSVTETKVAFAAANTVAIGANLAPTGTVTVSATSASSTSSIGAISIKGGTSITVNEFAGATVQAAGTGNNTNTMGAVTVTGKTTTTSVTVNQPAAATATTAVTPVFAVSSTALQNAAPGLAYKAAVAAVSAVDGVTGLVGVVDGAVTITDKVATASTDTAAGVAGGTITTVTLNNFGTASISSPALNTLSLSGTGATVTTYEGGAIGAATPTLTLNVNAIPSTAPATYVDNTNQFSTINVVTAATGSTLASITDTALKTLNVSGNSVLSLTAASSATAIKVTGAAGYAGPITDTTTTFDASGSTGSSTITIAADATKSIVGGSGSADELILNAASSNFTKTYTGANVSGFETIGFGASYSGTQDMSVFGLGVTKLSVEATGLTVVANKVNTGASINFAPAATTTTSFTANFADVNGANDTANIVLQGPTASVATTGAAQTVTALVLADANGVGIGNVVITDNNVAANYKGDTITTLTDTNISNLSFAGVGGVTITNFTDNATSFTVNSTNSNAAGVQYALTDNSLGNLTFTGTGKQTISALADSVAGTINIANSGTGSITFTTAGVTGTRLQATNLNLTGKMTFTALFDDAISSLTLSDGQVFGSSTSTASTTGFIDGATTGITINGAADNSRVVLNLGAAAATKTNTVTLGNGNNVINDATSAGIVSISVGSGSNLIDLHTGSASTYSASVTLGAHTTTTAAFDEIYAGTVATGAVTPSVIITGAIVGDGIKIADNTSVATAFTAAQAAAIAAQPSLSAAITYVDGTGATGTALAAQSAQIFVWGGNSYIIESHATGSGTLTSSDSLVEIVGVHTLSSTATGILILAS